MKDIVVVCEDLFGLEICSIIEQINKYNQRNECEIKYNIIGYISDKENPFGHVVLPIKRIGAIQDWKPFGDEAYILGIKYPERKKDIVRTLKKAGCTFETVLAPWTLTPPIEIGEGSVVAAYSIKGGIVIGKFVTLIESMLTCQIVGDYSTILRFSNITGNVGSDAYIGNHVYTHLGKPVEDGSYITDGSIVVKKVKAGATVAGVPARNMKNKTE